ncbi:MAG: heme exporter protein CcmB [Fimbriimonadaceae bacterium]|nr:heme exporter protein CcmB [Fimbriimonadaceae bacterium]QYK56297.1 MAG: heme exporter protein CcmB [Fimbriimonadaceae bacterium]
MKSPWWRSASAIFRKEWRSEMRSRHGLFTAGLFALLSVIATSLASFGQTPPPALSSGVLAVTLVFAAVVSIPRLFLAEDDQGTFDLLRLLADPSAAFAGKALYALLQTVVVALALGLVYIVMTSAAVPSPTLFVLGLLASSAGMALGVSVCGALAVGAANRWVLASVVSMPVLFPQVFMTVSVLRAAMGGGGEAGGYQALVGLVGWAVVLGASGPTLIAQVWCLSDGNQVPNAEEPALSRIN